MFHQDPIFEEPFLYVLFFFAAEIKYSVSNSLIVVVFIIGIITAIALPQYQTAVLKTRITSAVPITKNIKDSAERYYLVNGAYPDKWSDLVDIVKTFFQRPSK
jgi:Tfp pilus assembly protein PilE